MCADGAKPVAERVLYPNAIAGLYRIAKDEGIRVFGRGLTPTVVRSVLMSKPNFERNIRQVADTILVKMSHK